MLLARMSVHKVRELIEQEVVAIVSEFFLWGIERKYLLRFSFSKLKKEICNYHVFPLEKIKENGLILWYSTILTVH